MRRGRTFISGFFLTVSHIAILYPYNHHTAQARSLTKNSCLAFWASLEAAFSSSPSNFIPPPPCTDSCWCCLSRGKEELAHRCFSTGREFRIGLLPSITLFP